MPCLAKSSYTPPAWAVNPHVQTLLRVALPPPPPGTGYQRERIATPDGDYLDLDWRRPFAAAPRRPYAVVIAHGLEGSSASPYVLRLASVAAAKGWEAVAWNFRGCSGEPNRAPRLYHGGCTDDLAAVLDHVRRQTPGRRLVLAGFSLGGSIVMKYLGDLGESAPADLAAAVCFSVPTDLAASAAYLERPEAKVYLRHFMTSLRSKVAARLDTLPLRLTPEELRGMRTFADFDSLVTAPLHGFADAQDYYRRCSCGPGLEKVRVRSLIINAQDDPFLPEACFPRDSAARSPWVHLETPRHGGHCGFLSALPGTEGWMARRLVEFVEEGEGR